MKRKFLLALCAAAVTGSVLAQDKKPQPPPSPTPPKVVRADAPPPPPPPKLVHAEMPPPPPPPPAIDKAEFDAFVKRHPEVEGIQQSNRQVELRLKSGEKERYDLTKPEEREKLKAKYGDLPHPPPPPRVLKAIPAAPAKTGKQAS